MHRKNMDVWKFSIELVLDIYQLCSSFPASEKFGLSSQMKRAAISIPSNIAEEAAKDSKKAFIRYLNISLGSLNELDTQLIIAEKLNLISDQPIFQKKNKDAHWRIKKISSKSIMIPGSQITESGSRKKIHTSLA